MQMQVALSLRGNIEKTVSMTVVFANHCYTRSLEDHEIAANIFPQHEIIEDGSSKHSRPRVFDLSRYTLSLQLPTLFTQLVANQGRVYGTSHHNVLSVQLLQNNGSQHPYVYFIKVAKDKEHKRLLVHIESAYSYDLNDPPFDLNKPQSLMKLLSKKWSD